METDNEQQQQHQDKKQEVEVLDHNTLAMCAPTPPSSPRFAREDTPIPSLRESNFSLFPLLTLGYIDQSASAPTSDLSITESFRHFLEKGLPTVEENESTMKCQEELLRINIRCALSKRTTKKQQVVMNDINNFDAHVVEEVVTELREKGWTVHLGSRYLTISSVSQ